MTYRYIKIIENERVNNSINWNPRYKIEAIDILSKERLTLHTPSDAWWVYGIPRDILNMEACITEHPTKLKIIVDKITFMPRDQESFDIINWYLKIKNK